LNSKKPKKRKEEDDMEDSKTEFKVKTYRDGGPLKMEENLHLSYQANTLCLNRDFPGENQKLSSRSTALFRRSTRLTMTFRVRRTEA
jgi:hypothetical protein